MKNRQEKVGKEEQNLGRTVGVVGLLFRSGGSAATSGFSDLGKAFLRDHRQTSSGL